jgi:hypothetical protein
MAFIVTQNAPFFDTFLILFDTFGNINVSKSSKSIITENILSGIL